MQIWPYGHVRSYAHIAIWPIWQQTWPIWSIASLFSTNQDSCLGEPDVHLAVARHEPVHFLIVGLHVLVGGTRAGVIVLHLCELDVHLGVVLHEPPHPDGVVLLVLHVELVHDLKLLGLLDRHFFLSA